MIGGYSLFAIFPMGYGYQEVMKELTIRQVCKFCATYPYPNHPVKHFYCQERAKVVYKTTGIRLYCYKPIDDNELERRRIVEFEWRREKKLESYNRWVKRYPEKNSARRKRWIEEHREEVLAEKRKFYHEHRDREIERCLKWHNNPANKQRRKEYNVVKRAIDSYDPIKTILHHFRYYDRKERAEAAKLTREAIISLFTPSNMMDVPFNTHLTREDDEEIHELERNGIIGDILKRCMEPPKIPEIHPIGGGSSQSGGIQKTWKSHPHAYRRRLLKFLRDDMT